MDTIAPTVSFADNIPGVVNRSTALVTYTLTFSEVVLGLEIGDFQVTNGILGTLAPVAGSSLQWTVSVAPALGVASGNIGLTLKAGAVTDIDGNPNAVASNSTQAIDTMAPMAPKLVINASFHYLVNPQITIQTSLGTIVVDLYPEQAPATVANMLGYVSAGFYDSTIFHRVIPGFMVQGGGFGSGMVNWGTIWGPIPLESNNGLANLRGTIAMARTNVADSATTQFFINQVDNNFLNYSSAASPGYTVFGKVVTGLSVVDSIASVATTTVGSFADVPVSNVTITSVRQSLSGTAITNSGSFSIAGLEAGAQWIYSLNSGGNWFQTSGSNLVVPDGNYAANAIRVAQLDAAGNYSAFYEPYTSALTVDTVAPILASFTPADEAVGVELSANLQVGFNETVERGAGTILLKNAVGNVVESFDAATSTRITLSGTSLIIDPSSDLVQGTAYSLVFATGTFKDLAGNAFGGSNSYSFTTRGNALPSGTVAIVGFTSTGQTLTLTNTLADADGLGSMGYQWRADNANISGANASTYTLTAAELGKTITVVASYVDALGTTETVSSLPTDAVSESVPGDLHGMVYQWKNHTLLGDVMVQASANAGLARQSTGTDGQYQFNQVPQGSYGLVASRATTDSGSAITSADALAALRIAVGLNPNPDPDGPGPLGPLKVSPYQYIAADVNGDGKVTSADALAILRMAVKSTTASPQEWIFVPETRDLWDESSQSSSLTRLSAAWDHSASLPVVTGSVMNWVGVLKGDVNGSWAAPVGSQDLDVLNPTYIQLLGQQLGQPTDVWGV